MSKFEDGSYGSLTGVALLGKILAGRCGMKYTRAAVGKGTIPDDMTPKAMTGCADYVMDAKIAAVTNPVDGECQVTVQIKSDDVETGFYLTNIVLFAEDPDEGDVAYTYLSLENEPEWIRPASSIVGKLATFDLIAVVGDVDAVEANIDPDAVATIAAVRQLITDATVVMDITIPSDGWQNVTNEDAGEYSLYQDISVSGVTETMTPFLCVYPADMETATVCGISSAVRTLEGAVRVYTQTAPSQNIAATLILLCASSGAVSGGASSGSSYTLPTATVSRLGGVKVGDGLSVTSDGTLSVDTTSVTEDISATDEEASEAITDALSGGE